MAQSTSGSGTPKKRPRVFVTTLLITLGSSMAIVVALFTPWNIAALSSHPDPAQNYAQAVQRIETLQAGESNLNPVCKTRFMTHGQKVQRAIIFAHGYTTCPQQFYELGKRFYELGYNVLIVPVPHHGLAERMTDEQGLITAEELTTYADRVVDIAQGLGQQVVMAGISQGGVITGWAAQNRSDLELAVLISPGFGFKQIPTAFTVPIANFFLLSPVSFEWWDPALQERISPAYAYPRFSRRILGEIMRLGFAVRAEAQQTAPAAHSILVITNANDTSVNNELIAQVVQDWRARGARLSTYEFGIEQGLGHDVIDPNDKQGNIELVYAKLVELIDK
jgi:pimeloyl-ACP methyl ester carboxylesterase